MNESATASILAMLTCLSMLKNGKGAAITESPRIFRRVFSLSQSLDVGADRVACTAHAALSYMHDISRMIDRPIPMAWSRHLELQ